MASRKHTNKHIRAAIEYAVSQGWNVRVGGAHAFVVITCGFGRGGCQMSVWSTPRNPESHAKRILSYVKKCPHNWPGKPATEDEGNEE